MFPLDIFLHNRIDEVRELLKTKTKERPFFMQYKNNLLIEILVSWQLNDHSFTENKSIR